MLKLNLALRSENYKGLALKQLEYGFGVEKVGIGLKSHNFITSMKPPTWFPYMNWQKVHSLYHNLKGYFGIIIATL